MYVGAIKQLSRLPPVFFALHLAAGSIAQRFLPLPLGLPSPRAALISGAIVLFVALAIAIAGLFELKRHKTPVEPWQTPNSLVTTGIYARSRNPLYVALVLILAAIALMADALWLAIATILLLITLDRRVIRAEEELVSRTFGAQYDDYRRRVRRWL